MKVILSVMQMEDALKRNGWHFVKWNGKGSSHCTWSNGVRTADFVLGHKDAKTSTFIAECNRQGIDWKMYDKQYYKRKRKT